MIVFVSIFFTFLFCTKLLSSSSLMGFFRPYMLCFYRNDWEADPWFHYCVCQHIWWDIRSRTLNQLGIINIPSRFRGQDGIFFFSYVNHIYVYTLHIYIQNLYCRFVSFAELGCRLQRFRNGSCGSKFGKRVKCWRKCRSTSSNLFNIPPLRFVQDSWNVRGHPLPHPPQKKQVISEGFPKATWIVMPYWDSFNSPNTFNFYLPCDAFFLGWKLRCYFTASTLKTCGAMLPFSILMPVATWKSNLGFAKCLSLGVEDVTRFSNCRLNADTQPPIMEVNFFVPPVCQYVNLPSWLICHQLLCTGNDWLPSPSWF